MNLRLVMLLPCVFAVVAGGLSCPASRGAAPAKPAPELRAIRELWRPGAPHLFQTETLRLDFNDPGARIRLRNGWQTRFQTLFAQPGNGVFATRLDADLELVVLKPRDLTLTLELMPHFLQSTPPQEVVVAWEGHILGACVFDKSEGWKRREFTFAAPAALQQPGENILSFHSKYAVARRDVNEGGEEREAAFALLSLALEPGGPASAALAFNAESVTQPAASQWIAPVELPAAGPCQLRFALGGLEGPAAPDALRVLARRDAIAGPEERVLYPGAEPVPGRPDEVAADLSDWAGGLVELVFDTSGLEEGAAVQWVAPAIWAPAPEPLRADAPALAPLPALPRVSRVVLVVLDACRADALGCYGNPCPTSPFIDSLAEHAILFENYVTAGTATFASTTSLLTSLHACQHGVYSNTRRLGDGTLMLQHHLRQHGVYTACIAQNPFIAPGNVLRSDFDTYEKAIEYRVEGGAKIADHTFEAGMKVSSLAVRTAMAHVGGPFFLYAHYLAPHSPYTMSGPYGGTFSYDAVKAASTRPDDLKALQQGRNHLDEYAADELYMRYLENVRAADAFVEALVNGLRDAGFGAETALIIASDHGESFGGHGVFGHGGAPYREQCHGPLLITTLAPEGVGAGARRADPVRTVDLAPTICALLGLPPAPHMAGRNCLEAAAGAEPVLAFTTGLWDAVSEGYLFPRYKLLVSRTHAWREVYDAVRDPAERVNLAEAYPVLTRSLLAAADAWKAECQARFRVEPVAPDAKAPQLEQQEEIKALGYL